MTIDLHARYLGLELASPLVASASPVTADVGNLKVLEEAGAGAVVLPSLFEEQFDAEALARAQPGSRSLATAVAGYLPGVGGYSPGPERHLALVAQARAAVAVPVIASLNGTSRGGWVRYARLLESAGADALELNVYLIATDGSQSSEEIERRHIDLVAAVRAAVRIPVAVKIGPFFTALVPVARSLVDAGAGGLVLFNRFYQPEIDLDTLRVVPRLSLSRSDDLRLSLRWAAVLRGQVDASLAVTSGVHTAADAIKALLAGADVAMLASALLSHGPAHLGEVRRGMEEWMAERGYASAAELTGALSRGLVADPDAYERFGYVSTITSYAPWS